MKAVANLFIARSRAAIFWFVVTCAVVVGSGVYVESRILTIRSNWQFVMAGSSSLYYLDPNVKTERREDLHAAQTRLAMEAIFNRGPSGLDHQARRFKLFTAEANDTINTAIVAPQVLLFRDTEAHQKVEIEKINVNIQEGVGEATTLAFGQLLRTSTEEGISINRVYSVKVFFTWKANPSPVDRSLYPTICTDVNFFSTIQTYP
jgi:hypothetical protein